MQIPMIKEELKIPEETWSAMQTPANQTPILQSKVNGFRKLLMSLYRKKIDHRFKKNWIVMTLMEGDWNCNVVGWNSIMTINQVSENGMFRGTLAPNGVFSEELVIYGSYNDASRSLRFLVKPNLVGNQIGDIGFVGFLFSSPATPEPGEDFRWIITGSCEVYELDTVRKLGGNSKRMSFGWTAEKLVRQ